MTEIHVVVKPVHSTKSFNITASTEDKVSLVKQYLLAQGPLEQPITAFSLLYKGQQVDLDAALVDFVGHKEPQASTVELEMRIERQTLSDVRFQIDQLRDLFGLGSSETTYVNGGTTRLHEIKRGSRNGKKLTEDDLVELAELPRCEPPQFCGSGSLEGKEVHAQGLIVSYPNPLIPNPAAVDLKLSKWQPLCRTPQFKLRGMVAFIEFIAKNDRIFHFVATHNGFIHVPQLTASTFVEPPMNAQIVPTLVQLIDKVSPSTINYARKNSENFKADPLSCVPIPQVSSTAPWLVSRKDTKICPNMIPSLEISDEKGLRDWNEEFQSAREVQTQSFSDRIVRDRSLVSTASEFAAAALEGASKIVEGSISPLNPDEPVESAKLYLHRGIFYSHGSDFANAYSGINGSIGARKAVKKGVRGVEKLMAFDCPEICPVLTAVIEYCGRCLVAQAPVPGIFREIPLIVYGQSEDSKTVHFDKQVDDLLEPFVSSCYLKKHPVNKEGLELQTSAEVHAAKSTDGRIYIIDLHRLQVPDLLSTSNELNLLRYEAVNAYFLKNKNADKLNPDVWMSANNIPSEYNFIGDVEAVKNVAKFIRNHQIPEFVEQVLKGVCVDPIDGVQLTTLLHSRGINMRLLGNVWSEASAKNMVNLSSITLEEAIARCLKFSLRNILESVVGIEKMASIIQGYIQKVRAQDDEIVSQIESRMCNHFGFTELPSSWTSHLNRPSLLRLLSLKCGLQWNSSLELMAINPTVKFSFPRSLVATEALEAAILSLDTAVNKQVNRSGISEELDSRQSGKTEDKNLNKDDNDDKSEKENQPSNTLEIEESLIILTQVVSIYSQVYGPAHIEVAHVLSQVATLFCEHGNDISKAIDFTRRAITIAERVNGLDSYDVVMMYNNLAYFEKVAGNLGTSLMLSQRVIEFYNEITWPGYSDYCTLLSTVGTALLQSGKPKLQQVALLWLQEAIERAKITPDGASGVTWFQYSQAQIIQHDYENASRSMENSYKVFKAKYGPEDENTKDVKKYLEQLLKATISCAQASKVEPKNSAVPSTTRKTKAKSNKSKKRSKPQTQSEN